MGIAPRSSGRKAVTKSKLLAAAAKVFAKKGFYAAAVDDVADAAGLSKGAIYSNFRTKEALFLALLEQHSDSHHDVVRSIQDANSNTTSRHTAVVDYIVSAVTDKTWNVLGMEFVLYSSRSPSLRKVLAERQRAARAMTLELLKRDWNDIGLTPVVPDDEAAKLVDALVAGIAIRRLVDPTEFSPDCVEQLVRFQLAAIVGNVSAAARRST